MNVLDDGGFAVITGASSGIGRAIAEALAVPGAELALVGRDAQRLDSARGATAGRGARAEIYACDLSDDVQLQRLAASLTSAGRGVDVLVHAAGVIYPAPLASAALADVDRQYRVNVRAPLALTQTLLPALVRARGQIVFINSSVGLQGKANVGAYAGSKHALRGIADSLRIEVNSHGVRVLSVYAGTTATAMQQQLHEIAGMPYAPEALLQPRDVAAAVMSALALPRTAEVTDVHVRPMTKPT